MKRQKKRVVVIGGAASIKLGAQVFKGSGVHLTAIQTPADDGGSGGAMRRAFNMIAPGDARRAMLALSTADNPALLELFAHRYTRGPLKGQVVGNLLLAGLTELHGDFEKAIEETKKIMRVDGDIIPSSLTPATLYAKLENGQVIKGETNIDIPKHDGRIRIKQIWLRPAVSINPKARRAIARADLIIFGPGDLYTSVIPNLLVRGMPQAIKSARAKKVFLVNSISKLGETPNFNASDFVTALEACAGPILNVITVNTRRPKVTGAALYKAGSKFVEPDTEHLPRRIKVIRADLGRADRPGFWDPAQFRRILLPLLKGR